MNEKELELMRQQAMAAAFSMGDDPDLFDENNPENVKRWETMAEAQKEAWKAQKEQWKQEMAGLRPQREPMTPEKWEADLKRQQMDAMMAAKDAGTAIRQTLVEQGFDPEAVLAAAGNLTFADETPVYQPFEPVVTMNAKEAGLEDLPPIDAFGRPIPQDAADLLADSTAASAAALAAAEADAKRSGQAYENLEAAKASAHAAARKLGRKASTLKDGLKALAPVLVLVGAAAFAGAFLGAKAAKRR